MTNQDWQPIETAPNDGKLFLCLGGMMKTDKDFYTLDLPWICKRKGDGPFLNNGTEKMWIVHKPRLWMPIPDWTSIPEPLIRCSYCGKGQGQVKKLIAGPEVYICDECISLCNEILNKEEEGHEPNQETH